MEVNMIFSRNRKKMTVREAFSAASSAMVAGIVGLTRRYLVHAIAVLGIAGLIAAVFYTRDAFNNSPTFRLKTITVTGNHSMGDEEIAFLCGLEVGETKMRFTKADDVKANCLADPRLYNVVVELRQPSSILLEVFERKTEMYVALSDGLWAVSQHGEIYMPVETSEIQPLPILISRQKLLQDIPAVKEPTNRKSHFQRSMYKVALLEYNQYVTRQASIVRQALSLKRTIARAPINQWRDSLALELEYHELLGFSVKEIGEEFLVRFGHAPFSRKNQRLHLALRYLEKRTTREAKEVFVDNEVRPNEVAVQVVNKEYAGHADLGGYR